MPQIRTSATYMASSLNTHTHYALQFLLCEMIAFAVALGECCALVECGAQSGGGG